MKKRISTLIKNEGGQALLLVLALLGVGSIMLAPMLSFMGTGLETGRVYEAKAMEIYAADSGVEDAIWKIQNEYEGYIATIEIDGHPVTLNGLPLYVIPEADDGYIFDPPVERNYCTYDIADVNGKSVRITITYLDGMVYRVVSSAPADGSRTEIEAFVATIYGDYSGFTDNVITSGGDITLPGGGEGGAGINPPEGDNGPVENYPQENWPTTEEFIAWYSGDVDKGNPYPDDILDLDGVDATIGATYVDGDFSIYNSSNTVATLTLTGTLYITGDALIGKTNKDFILDLNGQTIFVESASADPQKALWLGRNSTITGDGCIIVIGDIDFSPNIDSNPDNFLFIMSVEGTVTFNPGTDFYGSIAGNVEVQLQPGVSATWTPPPGEGEGGLNFPGGGSGGGGLEWGVLSWKIS